MENQTELRQHVIEMLDGSSAHIAVTAAIRGFPMNQINERPEGSPHTAWELLEHMRIAQWDILEFSRDSSHVSPDFPDGYWNRSFATAIDWHTSAEQVLANLQAMRDLVADENIDLFAKIPHGDGQTLLREALLSADHNAYHLGQMMLIKKILESMPL